jgi:hypothetical protein
MTVIDSAARIAAQNALHDAVDELTFPASLASPCLLDQLDDALCSSSSRGGASSNRQSAPLALDVVILLSEIDRALYRGIAGRVKTLPHARATLMRRWAAQSGTWRANNPAYLVYAAGLAEQWVVRANAILAPHPPTREPYGQACPHCGTTTVFIVAPEGDQRVQRSALYLDTERVAVLCRACGDSWDTNHLDFLATLLAAPSLTNGQASESLTPHR